MEDPADCILRDPPSKTSYKQYVITKITCFHEQQLRNIAANNSQMKYFNVSVLGLTGRIYPALCNIFTPLDVKKSRPHLKMLMGDYLTYQTRADRFNRNKDTYSKPDISGPGSPRCRQDNCVSDCESLSHIIALCPAYADLRRRIQYEYSYACSLTQNKLNFEDILADTDTFTQLVIDPASLNLKNRVNINYPILPTFYKISRNYCYSIHVTRTKNLKAKFA